MVKPRQPAGPRAPAAGPGIGRFGNPPPLDLESGTYLEDPASFGDPPDIEELDETDPAPRGKHQLHPGGRRPDPDIGLPREMQDLDYERMGPAELRKRQERARHLRAMERNPFISDTDESDFPGLPDDDPTYAYLWSRHRLPPSPTESGGPDTSNLGAKLTGRLRYEYVRIGDLPQKWQDRLGVYQGRLEGLSGDGLLVFKDLVAMRTLKSLRDQKYEADAYRGRLQRRQVHQDHYGKADRAGYLANHRDREEERYVPADALPQEEEEA